MHRILQDVVWLVPAILEVVIAGVLFRQGTWRTYPVFWSFLIFAATRTAVLFTIGNDPAHYATYFYSYWLTEVLACLLGFFVVAEIFRKAFSRQMGLQERGTALFRFALILLIAAALLVAAVSPGNDSSKMIAAILVIRHAESLVSFGMVASLFGFVFLLGVPWSSHTIGISLGLAIQGAADLVALTARNHYGRIASAPSVWTMEVAGVCQVLVWLVYSIRREEITTSKTVSNPSLDLSSMAADLDRMSQQVTMVLEK